MAHRPNVHGDHGRVLMQLVRRRHPKFKAMAFAAYAELDKRHVSEVETGDRDPSPYFLEMLAEYLGDAETVYGDMLARVGAGLVQLEAITEEDERIAAELRSAMRVSK